MEQPSSATHSPLWEVLFWDQLLEEQSYKVTSGGGKRFFAIKFLVVATHGMSRCFVLGDLSLVVFFLHSPVSSGLDGPVLIRVGG